MQGKSISREYIIFNFNCKDCDFKKVCDCLIQNSNTLFVSLT